MNEPRRLSQSGGVAQRLLDSASIDKPSAAARRRAEIFASTTSAFSTTAADSGVRRSRSPSIAKTLVVWASIGAAASVALAFAGSRLLDSSDKSAAAPSGAAPMAELPQAPQVVAARPSDISPEPSVAVHIAPTPAQPVAKSPAALGSITPWVPAPVEATPPVAEAPVGAPQPARPSSASFDEVREIQAAREAVSRGDNSGALAALNQYDQAHPNGGLKAESAVLRVQALSNSGKTAEAKRLANEFSGKYPTHPLNQQLKSLAK